MMIWPKRFLQIMIQLMVLGFLLYGFGTGALAAPRKGFFATECEQSRCSLTVDRDGRVAVLQVPPAIVSRVINRMEIDKKMRKELTRFVYGYFQDAFDFIIVVLNREEKPSGPSGVYTSVGNRIKGLGKKIFDRTYFYGSGGKLRGLLYLPQINMLLSGPSLHELFHAWGNSLFYAGSRAHWGFASVGGQLGGFDPSTLKSLGNGLYQASVHGRDGFGLHANGGNSLPYGELELYLMGLLPPEKLSPVLVFANANWVDGSKGKFRSPPPRKYTIEDLIKEHGPRKPDWEHSQKSFRALFLVLSDRQLEKKRIAELNTQVQTFSAKQKPQSGTSHNFWSATRGKASIRMDGLHQVVRKMGPGRQPVFISKPLEGVTAENLTTRGVQEYYRFRKYKQALKVFDAAIQRDPTVALAYKYRAMTYWGLRNHDHAIQDMSSAIKLQPDHSPFYADRGNIYMSMNEYEKALADYQNAVLNKPDYDWHIRARSSAYSKLKQYDKAIEGMNFLIGKNPRDAGYYSHRGKIYLESKQFDKAILDYSKAIELNPNSYYPINNRGMVYSSMGDRAKANEDFKKACDMGSKTACHNLGR